MVKRAIFWEGIKIENTVLYTSSPKAYQNTELFSESNLSKMKQMMYRYQSPAGSHLFWDGEQADKLYYIEQGQVKITKAMDDGREIVLSIFQEGDLIGDIGSYGEDMYHYSAKVTKDSHIGVMYQSDLEMLFCQHGDLAVEFMKWLSLMHRVTQSKFRDLMLYGKPGALCSTLIRLSNTYGMECAGHRQLSIKLTNAELGELIGATRESVNRMLKELKDKDVITVKSGYIVIKNFMYLKEVCHCEHCPISICRI